ncbi:MAG: hypothetical protein EBZ49_07230 [Proteobacteria bacterium]|nr:hypothetical protein [Pseudomonadota bacterium]
MYAKKTILFLLMAFALTACAKQESKQTRSCATKEACLNDPNCECWCSQSCGWRKKEANDHPVYIENDPYGKHCYCKQWDFDHFEDNCIHHKNVKQEPGAK